MDRIAVKTRSGWGKRWLTLGVCICMAALLASIAVTDSPKALWGELARLSLVVAFLIGGIYEFVKRDKPKA